MIADFARQHGRLWLGMVCVSLLLSVWCLYADPIVNNDGVRYFRAATQFANGHWDQALDIYKWPFYPLLIGAVYKYSGLGIDASAHLVNATLVVLLATGFLLLIIELGGEDRTTLFIAALLILFLPALNRYRSFVIRDFGYLAAYVWSLALLLNYWRTRARSVLLGWLVAAFAAVLFRIEGLVFLILPPLLLRWRLQGVQGSRHRWAWLTALAGLLLFFGFLLWLAGSESRIPAQDLLRNPLTAALTEWHSVTAGLQRKLTVLRNEFDQGRLFAVLVYGATVLLILASALLKQIGVILGALSAYALWRRWAFPRREGMWIWWSFVAINLLILLEFVAAKLFLPRRYTLALVLTLLAAAPFALAHWYRRWREAPPGSRMRRWFPVLLVLCVIVAIEGLDVFTHKQHLRQAGLWLRDNMSRNASLYSDNQLVIYFSGRDAYRPGANYVWPETVQIVWGEAWRQFDYLAISIGRKDGKRPLELQNRLGLSPIKRFVNSKQEQVLIFAVPPDRRLPTADRSG